MTRGLEVGELGPWGMGGWGKGQLGWGCGILPALVHGLGILRGECMREAGLCSHRFGPVVEHRSWVVVGIHEKGIFP